MPQSRSHSLRKRATSAYLINSTILLSGAALALCMSNAEANAQCLPSSPASGGTVTCSSNQNGNYSVTNLDGLSIEILPGASINGTFVATGIGTLSFINGGNTNGLVTLGTTASLLFRNSGVINQGLIILAEGVSTIVNDAGHNINGTFRIDGDGTHTIANGGTVNNGIILTGNGASYIENLQSGTLNGAIQSTGSSMDTVDNSGTINGGGFNLGDGDDAVINRMGTINPDVFLGPGDDTFTMLGGLARRINMDAGDDTATISGGQIDDRISGQDGNDVLTWSGGLVRNIDMGDGTDFVLVQNIPDTSLGDGQLTSISGGTGAGDVLRFENTQFYGPHRLPLWELVELTDNSALELRGGTLTLGDGGTAAGELTVDATSTLYAGGGTSRISPFDGTSNVVVRNAGTIDLTDRGFNPYDTLVIGGNYVGENGTLNLQTYLGSDGSNSDRLAIDRGSATGTTALNITNAGGPGAETTGDGILIVEARNGATTATQAFSGSAAAGPYEYNMFRGSKDGALPDNWYLRTEAGEPEPCPPDGGNGEDGGDNGGEGDGGGNGGGGNGNGGNGGNNGGENGGGGGNEGGGGGAGGAEVSPPGPFRPEVALYTTTGPLALEYGKKLFDTLHERKGDDVYAGIGGSGHGWGRLIGAQGKLRCAANPQKVFSYDFFALQAGQDIYHAETQDGGSRNGGLFAAVGTGSADSSLYGRDVGTTNLSAYSFGGYWTRYTGGGWYFDSVLAGTYFQLGAHSQRSYTLDTHGIGLATSIETGKPFQFENGIVLEPQAQLTYQNINISTTNDGAADIQFSDVESLLARGGVRLAVPVPFAEGARQVIAWVRPSVEYEFLATPITSFSSSSGPVSFTGDYSGWYLAIDAGLEGKVADNAALFGNFDYRHSLDDLGDIYGGKIGLKLRW